MESIKISPEKNGAITITKYIGKDTAVVIPKQINGKSVASIGDCAFDDCSSLTNITIPASVTSIGDGAFDGCSSLTNITIPDSVTFIGEEAFLGCKGLADNNGFVIIRNVLYSYHGNRTKVIIPDSVTSISFSAFEGCSSLTTITIPDSVTSIGAWAFEGCKNLTTITIPDSVTSIGAWAFLGCSSLKQIIFKGRKNLNDVTLDENWKDGCNAEIVFELHNTQTVPTKPTIRRKKRCNYHYKIYRQRYRRCYSKTNQW